MSAIKLDPAIKEAMVARLQTYLADELDIKLGGFDAQFLLDFFSEQLGCHYYNQGLTDALGAFQDKVQECSELVYELEQVPAD
ncbi:MAG: DUF2164 domain-containing protein [Pseudohongiellaceae bacterium]|jgi:uncharacterized protein (DUF2164 family)